jgi:hypothetical protein
MERNVTKHTIDCLKEAACSGSPNRGLTPIEIQRWEDDGGAIPAARPTRRQRHERHDHDEPHELIAAE